MSIEIECAGFVDGSCGDGSGIRSVLFVQGCNMNCDSCHNSSIREHGKGRVLQVDDLLEYIDRKCCNKKVTISGGEPLEQLEGLLYLLKNLKARGYNVCLYTGWELNQAINVCSRLRKKS